MSIRPSAHNSIRVGPSKSRPTGLYFVLLLSLLANVYFVLKWQPSPSDPDTAVAEGSLTETTVATARAVAEAESEGQNDEADSAAGSATEEPAAAEGRAGGEAAAPAAEGTAVGPGESTQGAPIAVVDTATTAAASAVLPAGSRYLRVVVEGAISSGFEKAIGPPGVRLAMVASRLLIWNLALTRDPRKGDTIDLLYSVNKDSDSVTIHALRYRSLKFNRTFEAYRFKPPGREFSSYFDAEGREVPSRLRNSPVQSYQEITSLIGDGRGHDGMDFKVPVGSPVVAPWDGHVLRTNWNWKYNGNSIELRSLDGRRTARFLHLDKLSEGVEPKVRVKQGQELAKSGNTGRSFAPHLHYELSDGSGRVLDPLDVHDTYHPRLSGKELESFKQSMSKLAAGLSGDRATVKPAG